MTDAVALYDLSPALRLMLLGLVLALGPLAWIWLRNRRASVAQRLAALTLLTLFLTFDLVLFGAFTRLTDSGLGCPDWPGCYGNASPRGAHAEISQAQAALPSGPVTHTKAWIEMIHRYLATGVGVLILVLAAASWMRRRELPVHPGWPLATLVWVCLQGAFGALTVTLKLQPAIVTLHLLGGLVLLALLCRQAVAYAQAHSARHAPHTISPALRLALALGFALLWVQVALGGWVSTNYAVLACSEFPTCQGGWWPPMDFRQGFEIWRDLGKTGDGENITFAALTAIHYAHRLAAYLLLPVLLALAWALARAGLARQGRWLAVLALWQLVTGLSNVVLGWPLAAAVGHTGGAAALVVVCTWAWCASRSASPVRRARGQAREVRA
ncbi:COX15/CtaA family protein [Ramlibacter sp. AN1015]|uniref:COX15/CtaA family protein n=1 Tax=Ramlibacter sp. AN1015 TaxID=3133428 RepID=UPI0030C460CF